MPIIAFLRDPDVVALAAYILPAILSVVLYMTAARRKRFDRRRDRMVAVLRALHEAERAARQFQEKYRPGYNKAKEDDFVSDAASVFAHCSKFLAMSKDIETRVMLEDGVLDIISTARAHLVRELLSVQYDDDQKPFPHGDKHIVALEKALASLRSTVRNER